MRDVYFKTYGPAVGSSAAKPRLPLPSSPSSLSPPAPRGCEVLQLHRLRHQRPEHAESIGDGPPVGPSPGAPRPARGAVEQVPPARGDTGDTTGRPHGAGEEGRGRPVLRRPQGPQAGPAPPSGVPRSRGNAGAGAGLSPRPSGLALAPGWLSRPAPLPNRSRARECSAPALR